MKLCSAWLLVLVAVASACVPTDTDRGERGAPAEGDLSSAEPGEPRRATQAASLLRAWDHRRSSAWSRGDLTALSDLYTRGSRAGLHDRAMLAAYLGRGLRVAGLRTQVLAVSLRSWGPGRFTVEVTDRVVGVRAVGHGVRVPLPHDRLSTRVVSLRRVSGSWRVAEVTDAAQRRRPAPRHGPGTGSPPPPAPPAAG
ncbi:MAG TPA: hypothetical protein VFY58_06805 [Nocardioides sp.]|nr:hypothetical protein [Nocardioides sp.]